MNTIQLNGCPITCFTTPETDYYLKMWGGFWNDGIGARILGTEKHDLWFNSMEDLKTVMEHVKVVSQHHGIVCFDANQGPQVRLRTVCTMTFVFNGNEFPYEYDFGYGYPESIAYYAFHEGNFSCDCNRARFLYGRSKDFEEGMECGKLIEMKDFKTTNTP